ncbi:hypothetical protein F5Y06DRAFT_297705 [Hypoxylon sp. FL0890]|nr:hypothetical protein F5Y06DRAFT_297705 [Hypoxylon sp. FL0890]
MTLNNHHQRAITTTATATTITISSNNNNSATTTTTITAPAPTTTTSHTPTAFRELFNLLQFIDPKHNAERLDAKYAVLTKDNLPELHNLMHPYFLQHVAAINNGYEDKPGPKCKQSRRNSRLVKMLTSPEPLTTTRRRDVARLTQKVAMERGFPASTDPSSVPNHQYIQQSARGVYIASICQPEATYDISEAAQYRQPGKDEVAKLVKRLQLQKSNLQRGLRYILLDLRIAKIFVFVDGSFVNNKNLSSGMIAD